MKKILYSYFFILALCLLSFPIIAQDDKDNNTETASDKTASLTIAVINSDRPYHVAFIRYYDKNGDVVLNTSREFKIDISKSPRFATGSIKKSVAVPKDADYFDVTVTNCTNMHENRFYVKDLPNNKDEVTFVFRGIVEDFVAVEFVGIQDSKPCTFQIKGANTNVIFYADYSNVKKTLPEESKNKDISIEISETSLYKYKIDKVEKDKKGKIVRVSVSLEKEDDKK